MSDENAFLQLANWRRQVAEMYAEVRQNQIPEDAWCDFRAKRDRLFRLHPQTPLVAEQLKSFGSLSYFDYDPTYRVVGHVESAVSPKTYELELSVDGLFRFTHFADVCFEIDNRPLSLGLYWVEGYGGGLFLPFRDQSNGKTTYGGGRYLYDSRKGADFQNSQEHFILDFNFAYNPSCAYNDQWVCPLPPVENKLPIPVEAGEESFL